MAAEAAPALYTRGEPGAPDNRGESMVERHQRKIKAEREAGAHAMMKVLLPDAGPALRTLALENCEWDVDRARALIKRFREVKAGELAKLKKEFAERVKAQKEAEEGGGGKKGADAAPSGSSDSDRSSSSGSESDSDSDGGRGRKSSRHRKKSNRSKSKSKSRRKERSSKKSKKRKERDREDRKAKRHKEKRHAPGPKSAALTEQFGKYGIIRESDYERKRGDFQLWAAEVKKMEVEAMPKWEEKELFKEYCEDYNTGTLAHKKYYDYDGYVAAQAAKDAKRGRKSKNTERTTFNDEEMRRREIAQQRADDIEARTKQAYNELRYTTNKAQEMREQDMLREEMKMLYRTGKMAEARKIQERLNPDEEPGK